MKESPNNKKLEQLMHSGKLVAGGFLGNDTRPLPEIIDADASELEKRGYTAQQIASRMKELTEKGKSGLGTSVKINDHILVSVDESRGGLVCPWPDPCVCAKNVTTAINTSSGKSVKWSDLCIHLIGEHGFFQGHGSAFRLNPSDLIDVIF